MSTYNLQLPEKITFLTLNEYAKNYVSWKSLALSTDKTDDDDRVLTGQELKDIEKLHTFLRNETNTYFSIMTTLDVLYGISKYQPQTEGQAKRIVFTIGSF